MHYTHKYHMNTYVFRQYLWYMFNAFCTIKICFCLNIFKRWQVESIFPIYKYFYCDALYFIWEWQSIFMMYLMCLLYILCLRFAQWSNVLFSNCQKPTARLAHYALLSWANSMNFSPFHINSNMCFDTVYEHIVA